MRKIRFGIKFFSMMLIIFIKRFSFELKKSRLTIAEKNKYLYDIANGWAKNTIKYSELQVEVIGKENLIQETCVYVANHQSELDIPLIMANINKITAAVGKKELKKWPVVSYWMTEIGCVFIDRENNREGLKAIIEAIDKLKGGRDMLIFPEGTRSKSEEMLEFKKGSLKLATKANVPVVPITVDGAYKGLEGKAGDLKAKIIFHKPIYMENLSKEEKNNLTDICRDIIKTPLERK